MNELLNKAEDPEKMLNQIVEDMQKELVEFRQTYAEVAANTKRCDPTSLFARALVSVALSLVRFCVEWICLRAMSLCARQAA